MFVFLDPINRHLDSSQALTCRRQQSNYTCATMRAVFDHILIKISKRNRMRSFLFDFRKRLDYFLPITNQLNPDTSRATPSHLTFIYPHSNQMHFYNISPRRIDTTTRKPFFFYEHFHIHLFSTATYYFALVYRVDSLLAFECFLGVLAI